VLDPEKVGKACVPVNADKIHIVLPTSGPPGIDGTRFGQLTGLRIGDFGVVIANGKQVPVIVADSRPAYKIGEGSTELLRLLSKDGKPHTISSGVIFIMFPGSRSDKALSPDTIRQIVAKRGLELFQQLQK
jgi:hypothetical protein